ncbi:MAG: LysR family transcriptional regulator [Myxococcota bacterium]
MDLAPEIRCFLLVAKHGSFTGAAQVLGVPRSTVSRRLDRLESHLGDALFERSTRHLRLTDAGELLLERARPILGSLDDAVDDVRELSGTPRGTLRVSVPAGMGQEFLAEFLVTFHERFPEVRLDIFATSDPERRLADGFDVALCDHAVEDSQWIRHPIGPADRIAVASTSYLATHGTPAEIAQLVDHRIVADFASPRASTWPLRDGGRLAVEPLLRVNDRETLRRAVIAGLGVGVLPHYMVAFDLLRGHLQLVLPEVIGRSFTLVAMFPPGRRRSPKIRALLDVVDGFADEIAARSGALGHPTPIP